VSSPTGADVVRLDLKGPVATVTLCRPEVLNAQTPEMWERLRDIGRNLSGDVRVVVIRGEGRAFSAGLDLAAAGQARDGGGFGAGSALAELVESPERGDARIAEFQGGFTWLRQPSLITIAAVQGHAIGAGFQLALAADFRVLAEDAKFTMAEVKLGLVPDLGGTKRLVELVGYARALELCVTGRRVDAAEAMRIGLANLVVPAPDLDGAVSDLVSAVLAAPRDAVVEIKALIAGAAGRSYPEQDAAERAAQLRRIGDLVLGPSA
jgi:enoyl-CoA hydratase/carnithine racemase